MQRGWIAAAACLAALTVGGAPVYAQAVSAGTSVAGQAMAFDPAALRMQPPAYAPQDYVPQGYAPQSYAPQGYAPQGYAPQSYAPPGYAPQGYVPQGYAPQGYPPQPAPFAAQAPGAPVLAPPAFVTASPRSHHLTGITDAEKLRRLDIMLMVTSLRCRATGENFQTDFQQFESQHMGELNAAARDMRDRLVQDLGQIGADRAVDRLSVVMANQFGNGHPWLGCHELHQLAQQLAVAPGSDPLLAAADEVLVGDAEQLIGHP